MAVAGPVVVVSPNETAAAPQSGVRLRLGVGEKVGVFEGVQVKLGVLEGVRVGVEVGVEVSGEPV